MKKRWYFVTVHVRNAYSSKAEIQLRYPLDRQGRVKEIFRRALYPGISVLDHFILPAHEEISTMSFSPKNNCIYGEVF